MIQTRHHHIDFTDNKFLFSTQIMLNLTPTDANDQQGLMRRYASNKQTTTTTKLVFDKQPINL